MWGRGQLFCLCLAVVVLFAICFWCLLFGGLWGEGREVTLFCVCVPACDLKHEQLEGCEPLFA